jgi:hypothetical protein
MPRHGPRHVSVNTGKMMKRMGHAGRMQGQVGRALTLNAIASVRAAARSPATAISAADGPTVEDLLTDSMRSRLLVFKSVEGRSESIVEVAAYGDGASRAPADPAPEVRH